MWRGEDKLAVQVGQVGHYGTVIVEAEPVDCDGALTLDFDPSVPDKFKCAALFGIEYALEHLSQRTHFPNGGRVRVLHIGSNPVDTKSVVIAFVAANAMYKALGIEPTKKPAFDKETGMFTFPK